MALKQNINGQYVISTKEEAQRALTMMVELQESITEQMEEYGISEMMQDAAELKKAATAFCVSKKIDKLRLPKAGKYATMVRAVQERIWIGTRDDLYEYDRAGATDKLQIKPLKSLVSKEVWMKITKRVPDPERIDQAVAEGIVSLDEIAPAYVERYRAPFLRVYDENNGD